MSIDFRPQLPRMAVLIPCFNEELTIAEVVADFRAALPSAEIYVFDNDSTDRSVSRATAARAHVFRERRRGKGYVLQSMFRDIDTDVYVVVDGDRTYSAEAAQSLLEPIVGGRADMVIGARLHAGGRQGFSTLHWWGNHFFVVLARWLFGITVTDLLSGYRVLTRPVASAVRLSSGGFQVETELTIKAMRAGFRVLEVPVHLAPRPAGSRSKIQLPWDGLAILAEMLALFRREQPAKFAGVLAATVVTVGALFLMLLRAISPW
jgi:glycosyltransferase involved in cell wall biosynthesis